MAFISLAKSNELVEGFKRSVKLPGLDVVIVFLDGEVFIFENRCPHMDVPLVTGALESASGRSGPLIRCRAHGIGFDLVSGKADGVWSDMLQCLRRFEPVYRNYGVGIDVDSRGERSRAEINGGDLN
jgi:nitrite reductase/ring-hydroxylating ferredoxin subunit